MKKLLSLILSLTMLLGMVACAGGDKETTASNDSTTSTTDNTLSLNLFTNNKFPEYLNDINFVPGLSQGNFISQLEGYTYNGEKITELGLGIMMYDGTTGGGMKLISDLPCYAQNDYEFSESEKKATYFNKFMTRFQLDGFALPYEVTFDDTLEAVLQKLQIDIDLQIAFEKTNTVVLYDKDGATLKLTSFGASPEKEGEFSYSYELEYTENYKTTRDERDEDVTRWVVMAFNTSDAKLGKIEVSVIETYAQEG